MSYTCDGNNTPRYAARTRADVKADLAARGRWVPRHTHDDRGTKLNAPHFALSPKCLLTTVCDEYLGEGFSVQAEKRPSQAAPKPSNGRPAFGEVRSYRVPAAGERTHAKRRPTSNPTPAYTGTGTELAAGTEFVDGRVLRLKPGTKRFVQYGELAASQMKR